VIIQMELNSAGLEGAFLIRSQTHQDARGTFQKIFHAEQYTRLGLNQVWREAYWSRSNRGVIRGMHFQVPPADHAKLVCCISGRVQDAIVDLRHSSSTYGQYRLFELNSTDGELIYIPRGCAHGFLALEDNSVLLYQVESVHSPDHDKGIRWDTCGIPWRSMEHNPILSPRDRGFPALVEYNSPF
jgi:dTDP-4-dehydrorhamnose 3,5-epimerase